MKKNDLLNFLFLYVFCRRHFQKEKACFLELKKIEQFTDAQKSELQDKKLLEILCYAYENCPYYTQLFEQNNIDFKSIACLQKIPFLTKDIIRKNAKIMFLRGVKKISLMKRNTGGSTGEPLGFYSDLSAGAIDLAHHRYVFNRMGYEKGDIIASSGGVFIPQTLRNRNIFWINYAKNNMWSHIEYSALYLNDDTVGFYINHLRKTRPALLRGYPSFWNMLAEYILLHGIRIDFRIKGVNLTAEMCSPMQRENIEKAFSTMVYFEYGHSEMSVFCYTRDKTYIYRASPLYGYVEVIKENGEYAQPGEEGEIIATSFLNKGMPFIRYKTGDLGLLSDRVGGLVSFKEIRGRVQDYIISKTKEKIPLNPLTIGQHLETFQSISKWQFIQEEIGKINIKIVRLPGYSQKDEDEIRRRVGNVANVELQFDYVDEIPLTQAGKQPFLIQKTQARQ